MGSRALNKPQLFVVSVIETKRFTNWQQQLSLTQQQPKNPKLIQFIFGNIKIFHTLLLRVIEQRVRTEEVFYILENECTNEWKQKIIYYLLSTAHNKFILFLYVQWSQLVL
jgi:hypothetical protein